MRIQRIESLVSSDNGGYVGPTDNDPLRHCKGAFWDGGLLVPLLVRQPGTIPAGLRTDTLVHPVANIADPGILLNSRRFYQVLLSAP